MAELDTMWINGAYLGLYPWEIQHDIPQSGGLSSKFEGPY